MAVASAGAHANNLHLHRPQAADLRRTATSFVTYPSRAFVFPIGNNCVQVSHDLSSPVSSRSIRRRLRACGYRRRKIRKTLAIAMSLTFVARIENMEISNILLTSNFNLRSTFACEMYCIVTSVHASVFW